MRTIKQYRTHERGFSDLLLYFGLVADGVIQLYDGCLMAAWSYRGPDLQAATNAEMSSIVARLNNVLKLGSGWMIHVDCMRSSAPGYPEGGAFPSITGRVIDDERRQQFTQERAHFESEYVLTLTYRVPAARKKNSKAGSTKAANARHAIPRSACWSSSPTPARALATCLEPWCAPADSPRSPRPTSTAPKSSTANCAATCAAPSPARTSRSPYRTCRSI
jgi:hypothetical protein